MQEMANVEYNSIKKARDSYSFSTVFIWAFASLVTATGTKVEGVITVSNTFGAARTSQSAVAQRVTRI